MTATSLDFTKNVAGKRIYSGLLEDPLLEFSACSTLRGIFKADGFFWTAGQQNRPM